MSDCLERMILWSGQDLGLTIEPKGIKVDFCDQVYPSDLWRVQVLQGKLQDRIKNLEALFRKKDVQYRHLEQQFLELFEEGSLTDGEDEMEEGE